MSTPSPVVVAIAESLAGRKDGTGVADSCVAMLLEDAQRVVERLERAGVKLVNAQVWSELHEAAHLARGQAQRLHAELTRAAELVDKSGVRR